TPPGIDHLPGASVSDTSTQLSRRRPPPRPRSQFRNRLPQEQLLEMGSLSMLAPNRGSNIGEALSSVRAVAQEPPLVCQKVHGMPSAPATKRCHAPSPPHEH
ncbi:Hypothetical predicted protein, partial [Pelobates cultripes]